MTHVVLSGRFVRRAAPVVAALLALTACGLPLSAGTSAYRSVPTASSAPPATGGVPGPTSTGASGTGADHPTPGFEEGPRPPGRPLVPTVLTPGVPYRFDALQDDGRTGVTWSPCRPIHYVVRTRNQPSWGAAALAQAIATVSAATGLRFVYDGTTTEATRTLATLYQPARYGDRWAPVVIAWSGPKETSVLKGDVAGVTNVFWWRTGTGPASLVSGVVRFDTPDLVRLQRALGTTVARGVLLHELGHLVGLGHVMDKRENMYPEITTRNVRYAAGDLAGLKILGEGPCNADV